MNHTPANPISNGAPRTAFVTGGAGFLGRQLVRWLAERRIHVRCLVREGSDVSPLRNLLSDAARERVRLISGDLATAELEAGLEGVDVVYHLAAALSGNRERWERDTLIPTQRLVSALRSQSARFVLVSSIGVYAARAVRRGGTLDESTPVDPLPERRDPYTCSKIHQEQIVWRASEESGLPLTVVRPGVIYGPGRTLITSRVGLTLGPMLLRMGGGQPLPYTFVENCADAVARAGLTPGVAGETFNIVDDDPPTGNRILRSLRRQAPRIRSIWIPQPAIGPLSSLYECCARLSGNRLPDLLTRYKSEAAWKPLRYSNEKAKRLLDWRPQVATEDGLRRTTASCP